MPFYRITVTLRDKRIQGIRYLENNYIDAVTNIAWAKAKLHYGESNLIDVEAAMLSNHCTAVREYLEKQQRRREDRKFNSGPAGPGGPAKSRKDYKGQPPPLGERKH